MNKINAYIYSFIIMIIVAAAPSNTMKSIGSPWYQCIKSDLTPPNYVFPIAWTTLYVLIGIALSQTLLLEDSESKNILLQLYAVNLLLNVLWSFSYFGNRNVKFAFIIILGMIVSQIFILQYTRMLLPQWVFNILVPYLLWVSFATVLNYGSLNKNCDNLIKN